MGGGKKGQRIPFSIGVEDAICSMEGAILLPGNGLGLSLIVRFLFNLGEPPLVKLPSLSTLLSLETDAVHFQSMVSSSLITLPTS